jgi:cellulose synthase/poly-beta-1,6-N-acetylglucosamine synthase-like glycosyltransferase
MKIENYVEIKPAELTHKPFKYFQRKKIYFLCYKSNFPFILLLLMIITSLIISSYTLHGKRQNGRIVEIHIILDCTDMLYTIFDKKPADKLKTIHLLMITKYCREYVLL